jgi:hypothetical protein
MASIFFIPVPFFFISLPTLLFEHPETGQKHRAGCPEEEQKGVFSDAYGKSKTVSYSDCIVMSIFLANGHADNEYIITFLFHLFFSNTIL